MRIESKKYLYDIARAAKLALGFVADKSFADYNADIMLRSAVERQLEIVGEALAQLVAHYPAWAIYDLAWQERVSGGLRLVSELRAQASAQLDG